MNAFWRFAFQLLHYRRLMTVAMVAACLDAASAGFGFAALTWVLDLFFNHTTTAQGLALEQLSKPHLQSIIGDHTDLARHLPTDRFWSLALMLGFIAALALFGSAMRYLYQSSTISIILRATLRFRQQAFAHLIHAPLESVMVGGTADNLSRVIRDTAGLSRGLQALLSKAIRDLLMGVAFLTVALIFDPLLTLIFLSGMAVIGAIIRGFGRRIRKASKRASRAYGRLVAALQESLQAIRVVKVHNAEGYERRRFNAINRSVLKQELRARTAKALSSPTIELLALLGIMVVTLVAARYVFATGGDPKEVIYVLGALAMAGGAMRPLAGLNNDLQESAASAERLEEVLALAVEPNTRAHTKTHANSLVKLSPHTQNILFDDIHYRYPNASEDALRGISLDIPHGQTVAIVGPNGSGKTTLLSLLPRLIAPSAGRVLIDGHDIAHATLRSLRRQIAVVTQNSVLFESTIADNIAYGRRHEPRDRIVAAARAAFADEFIDTLPLGYDTPLGEGGAGLSGGQQQRLCIARAVLRDPNILILDEATSQIDADSEARITAALADFQKGRTTFIIAHRLSTVVDADLIIVMADGRIIDAAPHEALLARCPLYQTLTRTQLTPT